MRRQPRSLSRYRVKGDRAVDTCGRVSALEMVEDLNSCEDCPMSDRAAEARMTSDGRTDQPTNRHVQAV